MSGNDAANRAAGKALADMGQRFCKRCFQYRQVGNGGREIVTRTAHGERVQWNCDRCASRRRP